MSSQCAPFWNTSPPIEMFLSLGALGCQIKVKRQVHVNGTCNTGTPPQMGTYCRIFFTLDISDRAIWARHLTSPLFRNLLLHLGEYEVKRRAQIVLLEILLISSQNWHVHIFITTPFSVYPDMIYYGRFW